MIPTNPLSGARRFAMTTKKGNKHYYKGKRQSFVPGEGRRTGAPGKHIIAGTGNYRLLDDKVRYYVSPGADVLGSSSLRPYVYNDPNPTPPTRSIFNPQTSFSPNYHPSSLELSQNSDSSNSSGGSKSFEKEQKAFSKRYWKLSPTERTGMIMASRRGWWDGMLERFGKEGEIGAGTGVEGEGQSGRKTGTEGTEGLGDGSGSRGTGEARI